MSVDNFQQREETECRDFASTILINKYVSSSIIRLFGNRPQYVDLREWLQDTCENMSKREGLNLVFEVNVSDDLVRIIWVHDCGLKRNLEIWL